MRTESRVRVPRHAQLVLVGGAIVAAAAAFPATARAAGAVARLSAPTSVAPPATLAASSAAHVRVKAYDTSKLPVPEATVYVRLIRMVGGGSAQVAGVPLTSTYQPFVADAYGVLTVTYSTPATLPLGGHDVLYFANAASAATATASSMYDFSPIAHLSWTPEPIAGPATLPPSSTQRVVVLATNAAKAPAPAAQVCLRIVAASGGGTAIAGGALLAGTWRCLLTDANGQAGIDYRTPGTLPTTGTDLLYASDAPSSATLSTVHGYSYGAPAAYVFSPSPIAVCATLAAGRTSTFTVVARDAAGAQLAGASIYLSLSGGLGSATVASSANTVDGTALTSSPQLFVNHTTTKMSVTYRTPATLPALGVAIVTAQNAAQPAPATTTTYSYTCG